MLLFKWFRLQVQGTSCSLYPAPCPVRLSSRRSLPLCFRLGHTEDHCNAARTRLFGRFSGYGKPTTRQLCHRRRARLVGLSGCRSRPGAPARITRHFTLARRSSGGSAPKFKPDLATRAPGDWRRSTGESLFSHQPAKLATESRCAHQRGCVAISTAVGGQHRPRSHQGEPVRGLLCPFSAGGRVVPRPVFRGHATCQQRAL